MISVKVDLIVTWVDSLEQKNCIVMFRLSPGFLNRFILTLEIKLFLTHLVESEGEGEGRRERVHHNERVELRDRERGVGVLRLRLWS